MVPRYKYIEIGQDLVVFGRVWVMVVAWRIGPVVGVAAQIVAETAWTSRERDGVGVPVCLATVIASHPAQLATVLGGPEQEVVVVVVLA